MCDGRRDLAKICVFLLIAGIVLVPTDVFAYMTNQSAVVVVGQTNFSTRTANQGGTASGSSLRSPYGVTTNGTKLIVGDYTNNRVLIWNTIPTSNGVAADVVIGQTNFTNTSANQGTTPAANTLSGPTQVAVAGSKLLVTDSTNNRILIFNTIPTSNNASANVVVGQPDMATVSSATSQTKLKLPEAVSYDSVSGKMMISDWNNSRVLIYNAVPTSDGAAADVVLGQADFTGGTANRGGSASGSSLNQPYNAQIINSKLLIADAGNHRVLIYNTVPTTNGATADVVIGQTSLTAVTANQGGSVAANTLSASADVIWDDDTSQLLITDYNNQRVLIYDGIPTANNASAVKAIGQPNLTSSSKNQGSDTTTAYAYSLRNAAGGFGITDDVLIVADTGNNRVLIYDKAVPEVSSLSPTDNATGVSTTANLVLTFAETAWAGTGSLTIKKSSDDSTVETITVSGALLSGNGSTQITLNPSTTLDEETAYYITWTAYSFKDSSGNNITAQTSSTYWNFTTGDFTAPTLSSVSPTDDVVIQVDVNFVLTFSEAIQGDTGYILLKESADNTVIETIAANGPLVSGSGSTTITVNPSDVLNEGTSYYVLIEDDAFQDSANNSYAGLTSSTAWNFTTTGASSGESDNGGGSRRSSGGERNSPPSSHPAAEQATNVVDTSELSTMNPVPENTPPADSDTSGITVTVEGKTVTFSDIPATAWFAGPITTLINAGIVSGYRDATGNPLGKFGPGNSVTFAEIAKMSLLTADSDMEKISGLSANDSAHGQWSEKFIKMAEDLHLSVYTKSLNVNEAAPRGAVIQTVLEALGIPFDSNGENNYQDLSTAHPYAQAIVTATRLGIVNGDTDEQGKPTGFFRPDEPINRAEVAKIMTLVRQR